LCFRFDRRHALRVARRLEVGEATDGEHSIEVYATS
jgi:hypothetical protein